MSEHCEGRGATPVGNVNRRPALRIEPNYAAPLLKACFHKRLNINAILGGFLGSDGARGVFQTSERFVMGGIERLRGRGVKGSMDRVRTVICSLLPALWLVAAGHCFADPVVGRADGCCRTSVSATEDNGHAPSKDARSFEQSARVLSRRVGPQTGWGGLLTPAAVPASGFGEPEQSSSPLRVSSEALGLAKCWQFYWRTAREPRAPSSVS
jgi:hypothetical protein